MDRPGKLSRLQPEPMESSPLLDAEQHGAPQSSSKDRWSGFDDFDGLPWSRTPSVFWLLAPFALFTLAFGGIMVPRLNL